MARNHLVCRYSFHVIRLSVDRLCKIYGSKLKCPHVCERVGLWDGLAEVKGEEKHVNVTEYPAPAFGLQPRNPALSPVFLSISSQ